MICFYNFAVIRKNWYNNNLYFENDSHLNLEMLTQNFTHPNIIGFKPFIQKGKNLHSITFCFCVNFLFDFIKTKQIDSQINNSSIGFEFDSYVVYWCILFIFFDLIEIWKYFDSKRWKLLYNWMRKCKSNYGWRIYTRCSTTGNHL
jgi:hypothetical protein